MFNRWLFLIPLAALVVCAGCAQSRNLSGWGHSLQTAMPVATQLPSTEIVQTSATSQVEANPPPVNPTNQDDSGSNILFNGESDSNLSAPSHFHDDMVYLWPEIKQDYRNYYSWENFEMLVAGFSVAAVCANTSIDRELAEQYQKHVRTVDSDHFSVFAKELGTGEYVLSAMAAGWVVGDMFDDWPVGNAASEWGERSLRAALVGAPPMLLMQYVTGGARPIQDDDGSGWRPFMHSNGVSGHAFMGGIVFIDAAKMTENPWLKAGFYTCSALPAWSRINDDAHYPSQAFLGWWMAYCAATAVDTTQRTPSDWKVVPLPMDNGAGMAISYQY